MAFCNNTAACGHDCGRQDDHGGACDCYQKDCDQRRGAPPKVESDKIPLTLDETVPAIDAMLSAEDQAFLQKSTDPEKAIIGLHHSFGQHLRNKWGLWRGSPLALHLKVTHGIEHPDDMSHAILKHYSRAKYPTRYDRIAATDEDE